MKQLPTPLREKCEELAAEYQKYHTLKPQYDAYKRGFESCWQEVEPVLRECEDKLMSLSNEAAGALGVGEAEFRSILGNTNYECYEARVYQARDLIDKLRKLLGEK